MAEVENVARVEMGARLHWLPQELILFNGAALERRFEVELAEDAELLLVEPVIFGRAAMGEQIETLSFVDHIRICREGRPLYCDRVRFGDNAQAQLRQIAGARGNAAMASLVFCAPNADARLDALRAMLPEQSGISALATNLIALRLFAEDGFALRNALLPVLDVLSDNALPISWRL